MWKHLLQNFEQSFEKIAAAVASFLPAVAVMLLIVGLSLVLSLLVRHVLRRTLTKVGFDQLVRRGGVAGPPAPGVVVASPADLVGRAAQWLVLILGTLLALLVLDTSTTMGFALQALGYLPQVFAAGVILAVGSVVAGYLERSVLISAVNLQIQAARLLSTGVKWLVLVLAAAMALEHLRIGGVILIVSFSILFGGMVLTLALAVGLGSREMVRKSLEKQIQPGAHSDTPNPLQHL